MPWRRCCGINRCSRCGITDNDHKDPFDRLLVAQSLSEPLILLTADAKLARYDSTIRQINPPAPDAQPSIAVAARRAIR